MDFQNFCTAGKCMKFASQPIWHYPPHLRHVATLPWKIKNSNFVQIWKKLQTSCIFVASHFVIDPEILIFSVFNIASLSPYWLQIKFSMSLFIYLFTFAINLWHRKFATADVTAVFVNDQHGIQWRGQDFYKKYINTLSIHSCTCRGIKIVALNIPFVYIFFNIWYYRWISAENLNS